MSALGLAAIITALSTLIATLTASIISIKLALSNKSKVEEVHNLVNGLHSQVVGERNDAQDMLTEHGIELPERRADANKES